MTDRARARTKEQGSLWEKTEAPADPAAEDFAATPVMAQYLALKREHPDALLFFQLGDFFEMFFDDAVAAAGALDIALTKRGRHLGEDIPMCGVPAHSHEAYLARLIRKGFKVAICEQCEDPAAAKKRGGKAVVRRGVTRVVTAGTLTEDALLDSRRNNFIAAVAEAGETLGLAWLDVSTGAFFTEALGAAALSAALARIAPREIVLADTLLQKPALFETLRDWKARLTVLPAVRFDSANGRRRLETLYAVAQLDSFGAFGRAEIAAAGALVDYVQLTQKGKLPRLARPVRQGSGATMEMDGATRRNLELEESLAGERQGSLLGAIDRTLTGLGARLLAARLAAPLADAAAIEGRLDAVQFFLEDEDLRERVRQALAKTPDIERALARVALGRAGPRDLASLREGLARAGELRDTVAAASESSRQQNIGGGDSPAAASVPPPALVAADVEGLGRWGALVERLARALAPELPALARDGGFIASGYSPELDELRGLHNEGRRMAAALQARYAEATGVAALKVRHNNVLGYFIEVPAKQADRLMTRPDNLFIHRQTMANAVRFSTVELGELEGRIATAADKALALELKLFADLGAEIMGRAEDIGRAASALASLDVAAALGQVAQRENWCRPSVDLSPDLRIEGGRHPVVEAALKREGGLTFVANDCALGPGARLWLLTGPNMAGKSTFLRQNALIAILAQIGSFVPARAARIGIVDRLFSRVGAADDLARGRSTFMVEMVETAAILNQAGPRALVILDEIGRGTATFDGLSIAWATVEHLHAVNRCRALFATHYHELTALAERLENLSCHALKVKEWKGEVVFLHEVGPGTADRSYGIHVARLAGLPPAAVARAEEILGALEKSERAEAAAKLAGDLTLFVAEAPEPGSSGNVGEAEQILRETNPDSLSPKEALELIYRLKQAAGQLP
ncbi:MAG: DNA mismatch repair protein MutS [Rhodospirillales bacterium]|nr:DNA mismatch repair protein MutS [Rhodospirillales bacterium]MSP80181.1 DNA mismatch repair protein MutS [Rhodospirillales bacterium]